MELGPRDRLSQAFVHEVSKGRTLDSPYGPIVHLDLRHLGEAKIEAKIPFVRELCLKYERIDPVTELIPVRPVVHYMMGGVHTDIDGATPLAGLYAAGETACVTINGANRLGSNSLPECLVFGARAGRAAAEYAADGRRHAGRRRVPGDRRGAPDREADGQPPGRRTRARDPRGDADAMEDAAGIYRTGPAMSKGVDRIRGLVEQRADVGIQDTSRSFNTELVAALELDQHARPRRGDARVGAAPRGVPRRPPAHRLPRAATTSGS